MNKPLNWRHQTKNINQPDQDFMNKNIGIVALFAVMLSACSGSKYGLAAKDEKTEMQIREQQNIIAYDTLSPQSISSIRGGSRGPMSGLIGGAISLATNAIKQKIKEDQKRYYTDYKYALTDLYFYDQLSSEGPFDPLGMQFQGFRLVRTFENNGATDTAMIADFELDAANPYEIINNSIFRLKLKQLTLNYAKVKLPKNNKILNMDFEISFNTSYVNSAGVLFRNVELGNFFFSIRNAPLDKTVPGYAAYYEKLKDQKIDGQSFIVPRSYGYHIPENSIPEISYSQGAYTINVKVKESSKNKFVNQLIIDNSGKMVDALGDKIKDLSK
jgi:hypothetical protein